MRKLFGILVAVLLCLSLNANAVGTAVSGPGMLQFCAAGGKGVSYDSVAGCWQKTCGNYNWSAEVGGYPDYNTPTTTGGNSWEMSCTADGDATGDPPEEVVCLGVETIRMYAMADIMLAADNTCTGGEVYLPAGIYHNAGCGQSAAQVDNGCPVLQLDPTHEQRRIQMYRGVQLVGAGAQRTDPDVYGRDPATTWLVADHGRGGEYNGSPAPDEDSNGDGEDLGHWSHSVGMQSYDRYCSTNDETAPVTCDVSSTQVRTLMRGTINVGKYARWGQILGTATQNDGTGFCVQDDVLNTGVCSLDHRMRCTKTDATPRTSGVNGDCGDFGPCEGLATTIETDLAAGNDVYAIVYGGSCVYGDTADCGDSVTAHFGRVSSVGAVCQTTGRKLLFQQLDGSGQPMWPSAFTQFDAATSAGDQIIPVDMSEFVNVGGGYADIGFMQANWVGRNSANNLGDCSTGEEGTLHASGYWQGCDATELISLMGGYQGGFDRVSVWYSGGGRSMSSIDGAVSGQWTHLRDSWISRCDSVLSDASGWIFERNTWIDNDCQGNACISVGFSPNFLQQSDRFIRNFGQSMMRFNHSRLVRSLDVEFISNVVSYALYRDELTGVVNITGSHGYGNKGSLVTLSPLSDRVVHSFIFKDAYFTSHDLQTAFPSANFVAAIQITDYNGAGSRVGGDIKSAIFQNIHVDNMRAEACMIGLGGGSGDESNADHGLNRNIDDLRNHLAFKDLYLNDFSTGGGAKAFCLGNANSGKDYDANPTTEIWAASGPMPAWSNVNVNGERIPDWPGTQAAADVPDCDNLPQGTVATIHDDVTAAGTCAATAGQLDGGGTYLSRCVCNGAGTWSSL